jgi:hypothetical protein
MIKTFNLNDQMARKLTAYNIGIEKRFGEKIGESAIINILLENFFNSKQAQIRVANTTAVIKEEKTRLKRIKKAARILQGK